MSKLLYASKDHLEHRFKELIYHVETFKHQSCDNLIRYLRWQPFFTVDIKSTYLNYYDLQTRDKYDILVGFISRSDVDMTFTIGGNKIYDFDLKANVFQYAFKNISVVPIGLPTFQLPQLFFERTHYDTERLVYLIYYDIYEDALRSEIKFEFRNLENPKISDGTIYKNIYIPFDGERIIDEEQSIIIPNKYDVDNTKYEINKEIYNEIQKAYILSYGNN